MKDGSFGKMVEAGDEPPLQSHDSNLMAFPAPPNRATGQMQNADI